MRGGGGVRVGVRVGVAKACAVSVAWANWALIVAKKLTWSKGASVAVGQTGKGVLVTMYPPPATTVAASAVALKSTAGWEMGVSVPVGALDGTGLGSGPPSPPVAEQPRPSAKTNSMEITAIAICRLCIGITIQPNVINCHGRDDPAGRLYSQ